MKIAICGMAALASLASCGGARYKAAGSAAPGMPSGVAEGAPATAAATDATDGGNGATIATDPAPARPAPGQLTAGVWDDNLNFEFFAAHARTMQQRSPDLAAFGADEQRRARDQLAQGAGQAKTELDVQLVLDTTGSMGDELQYLQSEFDDIARQVRERFPRITPRWSLVLYKDRGDAYVTRPFDFTADTEKFRAFLAQQSAGGGGDFPEAVIAGLETGLAQHWRPGDHVAKLVFWVADAPPHAGEGGQLAAIARTAQARGVRIYPVASSGIDDGTEYQMRATAQLTGGRYLFLTDDSGIGNAHAEPHIPCYTVTRLDHAVVRMVESELSGKRATTRPEEVVRRVGNPNAEGACRVQETQVVAF